MTTMIDAEDICAANIPEATPKVAGYVSGTAEVQWKTSTWLRFPKAGHVRIEQGFGLWDPLHCDVFDVEKGAVTVAQAVEGVHTRIGKGITWTTIYGSDGALAQVAAGLAAAGPHGWFYGHVDCWLADWDLDQAGAAKMLGKQLHGLSCRAVQWASPTSNPNTLVPGSTMTLKQANVDLSVTQDGWHAYIPPAPHPPAKHLLEVSATAHYSDGSSRTLTLD